MVKTVMMMLARKEFETAGGSIDVSEYITAEASRIVAIRM